MDDWRKSATSERWDTPIGISNLPAINGWESAPAEPYHMASPLFGPGGAEPKSVNKVTEATTVPVPSTSTTVAIPGGWAYKEDRNDEAKVVGLVVSPPYQDMSIDMTVLVWDTYDDMADVDLIQYEDDDLTDVLGEEYALNSNRVFLSSLDGETATPVEINGSKYWRAEATGDDNSVGSKLTCISYCKYHDKKIYQYVIRRLTSSSQPMETLVADMEGLIASAVYG